MLYIIIPVAIPGILSAGIFAFTLSWNEFIYALAFIQSSEKKTVPVAILTELVLPRLIRLDRRVRRLERRAFQHREALVVHMHVAVARTGWCNQPGLHSFTEPVMPDT